jgi:hypothetical protein
MKGKPYTITHYISFLGWYNFHDSNFHSDDRIDFFFTGWLAGVGETGIG